MANIKLYKKDVLQETRMIPGITEGANVTYHADFHFSNINLSDSQIYKCEGIVDDDINSSFIIPSDVVEDSITVNVKSECHSTESFILHKFKMYTFPLGIMWREAAYVLILLFGALQTSQQVFVNTVKKKKLTLKRLFLHTVGIEFSGRF